MIGEEGMGKSVFMVGAIHRNTDNIHAHVATSELKIAKKIISTSIPIKLRLNTKENNVALSNEKHY